MGLIAVAYIPPLIIVPVVTGPYTGGGASAIFPVYNTSGAGFTFNLPATPANNQVAVIVDAEGNAGTHNITIQGNGYNIVAFGNAAASSAVINANGGAISLAWDSTNTQWVMTGGM